jgi:hypothetical protein
VEQANLKCRLFMVLVSMLERCVALAA